MNIWQVLSRLLRPELRLSSRRDLRVPPKDSDERTENCDRKGMGAELLEKPQRLQEIVTIASRVSQSASSSNLMLVLLLSAQTTSLPMTVKIRVGQHEDPSRSLSRGERSRERGRIEEQES